MNSLGMQKHSGIGKQPFSLKSTSRSLSSLKAEFMSWGLFFLSLALSRSLLFFFFFFFLHHMACRNLVPFVTSTLPTKFSALGSSWEMYAGSLINEWICISAHERNHISPQIYLSGIKIILCWRQARGSKYKRGSLSLLPFLPK